MQRGFPIAVLHAQTIRGNGQGSLTCKGKFACLNAKFGGISGTMCAF